MTLKPSAIPPVPELTRAIGQAAFPNGNLYLQMRDELGSLYTDELFIDLYSEEGQPGWSPGRLAWVTVMQFAENLSDRQAAEAVRARLDWKYALSLDLTDPGFHYSMLSQGWVSPLLPSHRLIVNLSPGAYPRSTACLFPTR